MQNSIPIRDTQNTADLQKQLINLMVTNITDLQNNVKDLRRHLCNINFANIFESIYKSTYTVLI